MIDDGEALTFQQCAPGFFPVFLHGFLRISPLPLAHSEGAVLELETVARLLEEDGGVESNCGAAGDDERLADKLRAAAPDVSRAVMDGGWRLWSLTAGRAREGRRSVSKAFVALATRTDPSAFLRARQTRASRPSCRCARPRSERS